MDYDNIIRIGGNQWILSYMTTGFIWLDILIVITVLLLLDSIVQKW